MQEHSNLPEINLIGENGKDVFTAPLENILLFHSSGNYIEIFWMRNQSKHKKLFRQTFAFVEDYLGDSSDFKKCHRCWLVNMKKVHHLSGNSKGYFLEVDGLDFTVPVSRNYISFFREVLS